MKKKVYKERREINHDGSNFGNKKVIKGETAIISVKKIDSKRKKGDK